MGYSWGIFAIQLEFCAAASWAFFPLFSSSFPLQVWSQALPLDHSPHQFCLRGSRGLRTQLHVDSDLSVDPGAGQQGGLADRLRPELRHLAVPLTGQETRVSSRAGHCWCPLGICGDRDSVLLTAQPHFVALNRLWVKLCFLLWAACLRVYRPTDFVIKSTFYSWKACTNLYTYIE